MDTNTIEKLKVATNLLLSLLLIVALVTIYLYKQDVKEAIGGAEPNRLVALYENKTDTKCLCANPKYGSVIFVSNLAQP